MHDDSTVDTQLSIGIKGGCLCVRIMKPGLEFNSVDVGCIVDERGATCFFFFLPIQSHAVLSCQYNQPI
jgi:hypothetical protein